MNSTYLRNRDRDLLLAPLLPKGLLGPGQGTPMGSPWGGNHHLLSPIGSICRKLASTAEMGLEPSLPGVRYPARPNACPLLDYFKDDVNFIYIFFNLKKSYFYWKGRFRERRRERKSLHLLAHLPKTATAEPIWSQEPGARSFFRVSNMGAGSQGFGSSSSAFSVHKQGAGWEEKQPG